MVTPEGIPKLLDFGIAKVLGAEQPEMMLTQAAERANARYKLTLKENYDNNISQLLRRSDSWPFLQHGVPAIWFHTGLHPDYHLTTDTADRINYEKMERIAKLVHQLTWDLAGSSTRPTLTKRAVPAS